MTKPICVECGQEVDPDRTSGNYQKVEGWVKLRSTGANEVALRRDFPLFMCRECMYLRKRGVAPQDRLLDLD